jgi:hypothetical protein
LNRRPDRIGSSDWRTFLTLWLQGLTGKTQVVLGVNQFYFSGHGKAEESFSERNICVGICLFCQMT